MRSENCLTKDYNGNYISKVLCIFVSLVSVYFGFLLCQHWAFPEKSPYPLNFEKKYWKIPGSGESFDGIPGGYSF